MTDTQINEMKSANLLNLLETGAFRFISEGTPWFPYTSGEIGPYYVQSTTVERDGAAYAQAVDAVVALAHRHFPEAEVISGGETRDWDFSNPAAYAMRLPHLKLYKDRKPLGADVAGKKVLHIADLNNEGSSIRDYWLPAIRKLSGELLGVVFFVDRLEDGVKVLSDLGVQNHSVVSLDASAWRLVQKRGYVNDTILTSLLDRMEDKHEWAIKTLLQHPDFFREFHAASSTRTKAEKIIDTYPSIAGKLKEFIAE